MFSYFLKYLELKQIEVRLKLEKELQDAVFNNDYDETKQCLKKISKDNVKQIVNSTTSGNHTLLYRACRNGNPKIVDLLIEYGAIAKPHYYTKYSPLYIACHMGNLQIAQMILNVSFYFWSQNSESLKKYKSTILFCLWVD